MGIVNKEYYDWYNNSDKLRMFYPSEIVVGFINNNLKAKSKILDLGSASGRHVILAAEMGHSSYGLDLSDNGFAICQDIARKKNITVDLQKGFFDKTPYVDNFFDAVVCISSIGGNLLSTQIQIVLEVYRILKKDGIFLVNFYGLQDGVYEKFKLVGDIIENRTLRIPGESFHSNILDSIPEYTRHFSTKDEIENMFNIFSSLRLFDMYLPYGNANMNENVMPVHHIYAMARK